MNRNMVRNVEELIRMRKIRRQWKRLFVALAATVMLGTTYALILPAITLDAQSKDSETTYYCGYADFAIHTHDAYCYDENGNLWCTLEEIEEHEHGDDCYAVLDIIDEDEEHVHTAACYGILADGEIHSASNASCHTPSNAEIHTPSDAGGEVHTASNANAQELLICGIRTADDWLEQELICGQLEAVSHEHGENCWDSDGIFICEIPQVERHQHTEMCMVEQEGGPVCMFELHEHGEICSDETAWLSIQQRLFSSKRALISPLERDDDEITAGAEQGIHFQLFNYDADINNNGHSEYFTFRGTCSHNPTGSVGINQVFDADGYVTNRAHVEPLLEDGYPVFDTGNADENFSLGYLFGDSGNGVTAYEPVNTLLQYDSASNHYRYDSAEHAVDYDTENETFIVRSYQERGDSTAGIGGDYADFMPFTYWDGETTYTHQNGTEYFYDSDQELDYWFGMTMGAEFFQPKDGILTGEEEMVFEFSGDDDVWVFIDDVLVLDLGGTHGVVTGSINFSTGEVVQHLDWAGSTTPSYPTTIRECFDTAGKEPNGGWNDENTTFGDYTTHEIKFFYLERGAGSANCKLSFNLPTLPDKSLTVTKDILQGENSEAKDFITDSMNYRFRVLKADKNGNPTDSLFVPEGTMFEILENGVASGETGIVDSAGYFELKAGQSAQFDNMLELGDGATSYIVEEIMPDNLTGQYEEVEYQISNTTGTTKTGDGPETNLTAFQTEALSAEEIQAVTYRNRVDTAQLCRLQITKELAPGAAFEEDAEFSIQVKLGDTLLPAGTKYLVGEEERRVSSAEDGKTTGCLVLKIGETAELFDGILSGTSYEIIETGTEDGNFNASYHGMIRIGDLPPEPVIYDSIGAAGGFPAGSAVHVTVTNASYDFMIEVPIEKQCVHNTETVDFSFSAEEVTGNSADGWISKEKLPGTSITVEDEETTEGHITIGYEAGTVGTFFYKICEQKGMATDYRYDETYYIVEIAVGGGTAKIQNVWKNGSDLLEEPLTSLSFVNEKTTTVIVEKEIVGFAGSNPPDRSFLFQAAIKDQEGNRMSFVQESENAEYVVNQEGIAEFSLNHGQTITLFHVPIGVTVEVTEVSHDGYIPYYRTSRNGEAVYGETAVIAETTMEPSYLYMINRSGYELPETGGSGCEWYTLEGMLLIWIAAVGFLMYRKKD